jgi:hypothetical protein
METRDNDYYNYEDEDYSLYDDNEDYDFTHHDVLLDHVIDKLQRYGCKYHIDQIEDFLTNYGDITLAEWSRDLMDPSISDFTCNYILQLLHQKYEAPFTKTPPMNNKNIGILEPLHENEKEVDAKCGNLKDNKMKTIFTKELKASFTRAAFQH